MDISVVVKSYNQDAYLREAIQSVIDQTRPPTEIIVVDDASTDRSREIIDHIADEHPELVEPVFHDEEQGIPEMINDGMRRATGDAVTYVDGDDRFLQEKLEREAKVLEANPELNIVYSNYYLTDEEGDVIGQWADGSRLPEGFLFGETFGRQWPHNSLFRNELMRRDVGEDLGWYDENLTIYEDWDFKIRSTSQNEVGRCSEPMVEYRQHGSGISTRSNRELHLESTDYIYRKNEPLLDEKLSEADAAAVRTEVEGRIAKLRALTALERSEYRRALEAYSKYAQSPGGLLDYEFHLEFLLPRPVFEALASGYRRARYAKVRR